MANPLHALAAIPGMLQNEPLAKHVTFQVGGPAKFFLSSGDTALIAKALALANEAHVPVAPLGGGSNVLVADAGFPGLIIQFTSSRCDVVGNEVDADAGTTLSRIVRAAIGANLGGIEFAVGVPGSFGGALAGNAGTGGHGIAEFAKEVRVLTVAGEEKTYTRDQLDVSYRYSRFKYNTQELITGGVLVLTPENPTVIQERVREAVTRRGWQPKGAWCAGCIFKNPTGNHAGKLIQEAGLKGKKIGGAKVSEEHANFIMNTGTATAEDIVILISYVKQQVRDKLGVQLEEEVRYLGFETPSQANFATL